MTKTCEDCDKIIPSNRVENFPKVKTCIACQEERENKGEFRRSKMEIYQDLKGWQVESINTKIIKGD